MGKGVTTNLKRGAPAPIRILVGRQSDGLVFRVDARDRRSLSTSAQRLGNLFVGYDAKADIEQTFGPLWEQIAMILTELSPKALDHRGVQFVDATSETVLFPEPK